jgi:hypothetical protein
MGKRTNLKLVFSLIKVCKFSAQVRKYSLQKVYTTVRSEFMRLHIVKMPFTAYKQRVNLISNHAPRLRSATSLQPMIRSDLNTDVRYSQCLTNCATLYRMPIIHCSLTSGRKKSQGVHLWHTARPKLITRFRQRHTYPAQCALGGYCSKFESVWMSLADSTVTQRQALGTISAGWQHPYIGFQGDSS